MIFNMALHRSEVPLHIFLLSLARSNRAIALEYLKEGERVHSGVHSLKDAWLWLCGILKSRRTRDFG